MSKHTAVWVKADKFDFLGKDCSNLHFRDAETKEKIQKMEYHLNENDGRAWLKTSIGWHLHEVEVLDETPVLSPVQEEGMLLQAAKELIESMSWTYKARNGRTMSIERDGEKCWIVPDDNIELLKAAIESTAPAPAVSSTDREGDKKLIKAISTFKEWEGSMLMTTPETNAMKQQLDRCIEFLDSLLNSKNVY